MLRSIVEDQAGMCLVIPDLNNHPTETGEWNVQRETPVQGHPQNCWQDDSHDATMGYQQQVRPIFILAQLVPGCEHPVAKL